VTSALALAGVFGCTVEELFGTQMPDAAEESWTWPPVVDPCRFWRAAVGSRILRVPVEATVAGLLPHDGVVTRGETRLVSDAKPEKTLVMASCDPAAGLFASEYERATGFRLIPLYRNSQAALSLLRQGLVHVAGVHLASSDDESGNTHAARAALGDGFSLLRVATWQEGLAMRSSESKSSVSAVLRANMRWIGRESGAGARQCQDELLGSRRGPRRLAMDHSGVAEAIRCGWADVGVCLRLVSEQAGLRFLHIRNEAYDLCFAASLQSDLRLQKLLEVLRSMPIQWLFESLAGYELAHAIDIRAI
jgi:molybdate-binding protein